MSRARLSIVICTYNGSAFLGPQLDSVLAQTRLPDEIVIRDDDSTDTTYEILQAFAARARLVGIDVNMLRNLRNVGYVENFSQGLKQVRGDVFFLCDQDDVWHSDKLAQMAARFDADPSLLLLHSDARLVDANGDSLRCSLFEALKLTPREKQAIHTGNAFEVVLRRSFVTGATAALRRELIELALPVAHGWVHDEWLATVAAATGRIDFIDEPLIDYRQHDANQIGMRRRTLAMKWNDLLLPRGRLLFEEVGRLQRLEEFFERSGFRGGAKRAAQIRHKRFHVERRVAIGRLPRLRRLLPILDDVRDGSYRRYGSGAPTVLRDMLRHD